MGDPRSSRGVNWKKFVWNLDIQQKIKLFLWRACNKLIPTAGTLFARHVSDNYLCKGCNGAFESVIHAPLVLQGGQKGLEVLGNYFQQGGYKFCRSALLALELLLKNSGGEICYH